MASSVFKAKEQPVAVRYWIFFPPVFYAPEALQFIPKEYYLSQIFFAIMKKMEKSSSF
jgi:hypothetical protein